MFWKVVGGIAAFFAAMFLGAMALALAGVIAVGGAVGALVENIDNGTVRITDEQGNTEVYTVDEMLSESSRIEVLGDSGEQVIVDLGQPQVTFTEQGAAGSTIVIDGSAVTVDGEPVQVRVDGRDVEFDNFDGSMIGRAIGGFFRGLLNLVAVTILLVGIWLLTRSRRNQVEMPAAKTPDATA